MHAMDAALRNGIERIPGLALDDGQIANLLGYLDLMQKWNRVYNLTSVRDAPEMLTHHLLDSLALLPLLRRHLDAAALPAPRLLDVGSGAGLPGVVIAIGCPDVRVQCVDTVGKKAAFIRQVAAALRLDNLHGVHARVEELSEGFDIVTSRAFASLVDFTQLSAAALTQGGVWMAMKGRHPEAEMAELPPSVQVLDCEAVRVPGLDAERCVVWMRCAI